MQTSVNVSATAKKGTHTYRTWTEQFVLRLTPEQRQRLEATSKKVGRKMSDFVRDVVMRAIDEIDEEKLAKQERQVKVRESVQAHVPRNTSPPRGLGLRPRQPTAPTSFAPVEEEPAPAAAPTVVVHNHQGAATDITPLAKYVVAAPNTIEREERERQVLKILRSSTTDQAEAEMLAKALDEKITALREKASPATAPASWTKWLTG